MMTFGIEAPPKVWLCDDAALNRNVPPLSLKVSAAAWVKAPPIRVVPLEAVKVPPVRERPPASMMVALPPLNVPPETERPVKVMVLPLALKVPAEIVDAPSICTELAPFAVKVPEPSGPTVKVPVTCSGVDAP